MVQFIKKFHTPRCILHVHSKYATALSTLKNPTLQPIDQNTMRFYNRVSTYNDFGGLGFEHESNKMASAIGNNRSLLLANHGILTLDKLLLKHLMNYIILRKLARHT